MRKSKWGMCRKKQPDQRDKNKRQLKTNNGSSTQRGHFATEGVLQLGSIRCSTVGRYCDNDTAI